MATVQKRFIAAAAAAAVSASCISVPVPVSADSIDAETVLEWLDDFNNYTLEEFAEDLSEFAPSTFFANWIGVYCAYTYMYDAQSVKPDRIESYFYVNENDEICVCTCMQYSHNAHITQIPHYTRPVIGSDGKYIEVVPTLTPSQPSSYFSSSGFYIGASGQDVTNLGYTITNERGDTRTVSGSWAWTAYPYYNGSDNFVSFFPVVNANGAPNVTPLGRYQTIGGKTWNASTIPAEIIPTPGMTLDELNDAVTNYYQTTYNFTPPSQPERQQVETLPQDEYSGLPSGWNEVNPVPLPDIDTPALPVDGSEDFAESVNGLQFLSAFRDGLGFWARSVSWVCEQFPLAARVLLALGLLGLLAFIFWRWSL